MGTATMQARTRLPRSATLRIRFYAGRTLITTADVPTDHEHHTVRLGIHGDADVKVVRERQKAVVTITLPESVTACWAKHKKARKRHDRSCPKQ